MPSMFYSEDIDDMFCSIKFINNAVTADTDRKLALVISHEGFSFSGTFGQRLYFGEDSFKESLVGFVERLKVGFSLFSKLYAIAHLTEEGSGEGSGSDSIIDI